MESVCIGLAVGVVCFVLGLAVSKGKGKKPLIERMGGVMNLILVLIGIVLALFTVAMIWLFTQYGAVPDTLITCVFAALGGECGAMAWIKTTKERNQERKWEKEDREEGDRID